LPCSASTLLLAWVVVCAAGLAIASAVSAKRITWPDVAPFETTLAAKGITPTTFASYVARQHDDNLRRVHEGDLDHLVFYCLQSTRITALAPIEPALSAKAFVEGGRIPDPAQARLNACLTLLDSSSDDARVTYFRALMRTTVPDARRRGDRLREEYSRAMRFLYEKEFVARRSAKGADLIADLYHTRGLSTDTEVEAGYVVYLGLGVMKAVDPSQRVRRVLIIGPGLDLAPRTGFVEAGPPESYQPWAVIDALVGLGLSRLEDLDVVAADINPRVIDHLRRRRADRPSLRLVSGIEESGGVTFSRDYRDYFSGLGHAIGEISDAHLDARLRKMLRVREEAVNVLEAEPLDIVTERLDGPPFDLVIATNILPYFDDVQLTLALSNVASMLTRGGVFLHNETRPVLTAIATTAALPLEHSRHVTIADVRGTAPLGDSVFLHRKR
jgi:hypothetical protein